MNLFNDDCLKVMRTMPDNSVDAIVTDPPYGILKHKIEQPVDINLFFAECARILKPNSFICYFGQQPTLTEWNQHAFRYFNYKTEIIWYKRQRSSPMNDIGRVYENIMVCVKGKRKVNPVTRPFCDVKESLAEFNQFQNLGKIISSFRVIMRDQSRLGEFVSYFDAVDRTRFYSYPKKGNEFAVHSSQLSETDGLFSVLRSVVKGISPQNLISFSPHNKQGKDMSGEGKGDHNVKHPTVKPIELMEYLLDLMTQPGDVVFDPFMGSGTTGIACKNLERDFIGVELDAEYFEMAQQRIEAAAPAAQNPIVAQPIQPAAKVEEDQLRLI